MDKSEFLKSDKSNTHIPHANKYFRNTKIVMKIEENTHMTQYRFRVKH